MRALANSILATLFVLALLLVLPLIAVFGVPEFVPAVASSSGADAPFDRLRPESVGVGQSAGCVPHDLFADFPDETAGRAESFVSADAASEFDVQRAFAVEPVPSRRPAPDVPLEGWRFDERGRAVPADDRRPPGSRAELLAASAGIADRDPGFRAGDSVPVGGPTSGRPEVSPAPLERDDLSTAWEHDPAPRVPQPAVVGSAPERFRREREEHDTSTSGPNASSEPAVARIAATNDVRTPFERTPTRPVGRIDDLDWPAAMTRLRELGIRDYTLTPGPDGRAFHFSVGYAPEGDSRVTHRFEAEGAEPLLAVRKVLAQIENWTSRQR
jgi:hypothetical protein